MSGEYTASGWVRDAEGRLRRETKPHMGRRRNGWDYKARSIYEITITLENRRTKALGRLVVKNPAKDEWLPVDAARALKLKPEQIEAQVELSELGQAVVDCWRSIPKFYPQVKVLTERVMPDHFHGVLFVTEPIACPLGQVIKGFKLGCNKAMRVLHPAILSPGAAGQPGAGLFAAGFVDTVLWRKGQLKAMLNYLLDNPRRLAIKQLFPELFKVVREIRVNFRLAAKEPAAASAIPTVGRFSSIGNAFLLSRPTFHQVQVSRRFFAYARDARGHLMKDAPPALETPAFGEKCAAALHAAKQGAVIVSPCISAGEREIARRVFAAGGAVITLANKGFSPLYKPGGKYFETCANGNLLMLSPIGWPYQPAQKPMTRLDALVLNRVAQLIVGEDAAEIDYKGVTIADIDEEVKKVV